MPDHDMESTLREVTHQPSHPGIIRSPNCAQCCCCNCITDKWLKRNTKRHTCLASPKIVPKMCRVAPSAAAVFP
jgi:hypothetical protein